MIMKFKELYQKVIFLIMAKWQMTKHFNRASLTVSPKMEASQMEIFNFLWLSWDH